MTLVLDASAALAWLIQRTDPAEAMLARLASTEVRASSAMVPGLWFAEVANTLLVFERAKRLTEAVSRNFLSSLALLAIEEDDPPCAVLQLRLIDLGRRYNLSAYDATYLELAMRSSAVLATFDRKLAGAARAAGVKVFGDPA